MQKATLKISEIKNNPNNPRLIKDDKFKKLVASIKEFPEMLDAREIVVNKDHIILGGNMRFKAAKEAGLKEVPVKIVDWSEDKQRQFVIKDNVSGGEWDWDLLANEWDAEELDEWGLDTPDDWGEDKEVEEVEEDEAPEVDESEPPKSKLGEIYQLGRHRVMCADSTVKDNVEKLMDGEKADMVFTDPPYGYKYESNHQTQHNMLMNDDQFLDFIPALYESLNDNCAVYTCGSFQTISFWIEYVKGLDLGFKNIIVWKKNNWSMGDLKGAYAGQHELIIYSVKGRVELRNGRDRDVWEFDREPPTLHPTMKPVELVARAIRNTSDDGQIVLDPFLGSGSTLVACEQTDRTCYGMELDPKYTDVIRKRYHKFVTGNEEGWEDGTPAIETKKTTQQDKGTY